MNYKTFSYIKLFLLILALCLAGFLAFVQRGQELSPDHRLVFVLDVNTTMKTRDVFSGTASISRLEAAKYIIQKTITSESGFSYGLIIFNTSTDYIVPPTFDTGTFLLYLSGVSTNLLPSGIKDFAVLNSVMTKDSTTSYLILSDFATTLSDHISLPKSTSLLGLGSIEGPTPSIFRNDTFARNLGLPYTALTTLDTFSPQNILSTDFVLPLGQRTFLYVLLGVFVILAIFL